MTCNPLHSGQTVADGIHIPYAFSYADASARTSATGFASGDLGKFARQTDDNSIWMLTSTAPTWVPVSGSANIDQTVLEHYIQHSEAIQTILRDLDGYHPDVTGTEHYNQHSEAIQTILKDLDGYTGACGCDGDIDNLGDAIQTILKDLDGYALQVDLEGLDQTVTEHYNQYGQDIQTILKDLDGYTGACGCNDDINDLSNAIQTILKDLDGYHPDITGTEHYNQLSGILQTILKDLDGYGSLTDLQGIINTELEHYFQHSDVFNTVIKDLDGYALKATEDQRWVDSSEQRQDIRDVLDGYTSVGSILVWGNEKVGGSTTTRYLSPGYTEDNAEVSPVQFRVPTSGTIKNMYVRHNDPSGNGNNIVYTLRVNSSSSSLTVTISSTSADGSDLVNTVSVSQGDLVDVEVTKASSVSNSPKRVVVTMEMT